MDELVQRLAHFRHSNHFADFVGAQIVELLPGKMLLLDLFDHLLGDFLKKRNDESCLIHLCWCSCFCCCYCRCFCFCYDHKNTAKANLELSQRGHGLPHAFVDHLAQGEAFVRQLSPRTVNDDFENCAHQSENENSSRNEEVRVEKRFPNDSHYTLKMK